MPPGVIRIYFKSPAVRPPDGRARTHRRAVIARASLYEQGGRKPGLRIQAAMAGAAKAAEPSTFIHGGTECELCMPVYHDKTENATGIARGFQRRHLIRKSVVLTPEPSIVP